MSRKRIDPTLEITDLYDGKIQIVFKPKGHKYWVVEDGERVKVPSVTTVCGIIDKSGPLVSWAINNTLDVVRKCVQPETLYTQAELERIFQAAKKRSSAVKQAAADIGTAAHDWIYLHLTGGNPQMPPIDAPHRPCIDAVLDWLLMHDVRFIQNERPVYSRLYRYSGRTDGWAWVDGKKTLIDFKTGNLYAETWFQPALYNQAIYEELGEVFEQHLLLRLGKLDGQFYKEFHSAEEHPKDLKAALGALEIHNRMKEIAKMKRAQAKVQILDEEESDETQGTDLQQVPYL